MARILFLAHRIPYPPNKGDKIRSWHFLKHLCENHDVHAGFFIDDKQDIAHVSVIEDICESVSYVYASSIYQKITSIRGLLFGKSLTECAYPSRKIRSDIKQLIKEELIDLIFIYSAAPYAWLENNSISIPVVTDIVDVDSAKWAAYAPNAGFPLNWLYAREARYLSQFEKAVAQKSHTTMLVSDDEATLFRDNLKNSSISQCSVIGVRNGVDCEIFKPNSIGHEHTENKRMRLLFTGAMDYAPNIDAVKWFADNVYNLLLTERCDVELVIAGGPVTNEVSSLDKRQGITVLGRVPDMAVILNTADIVIAPLQIARGIQNKVLEGMATARPVVATTAANEGINAPDGEAILIADTPQEHVETIVNLLNDSEKRIKLGESARQYVKENFSWQASLHTLDTVINQALTDSQPSKAPS